MRNEAQIYQKICDKHFTGMGPCLQKIIMEAKIVIKKGNPFTARVHARWEIFFQLTVLKKTDPNDFPFKNPKIKTAVLFLLLRNSASQALQIFSATVLYSYPDSISIPLTIDPYLIKNVSKDRDHQENIL